MLDHMLSVTNKAWKKELSQIVSASKQRGLILSGEGLCYGHNGHNAKYLTYSLFDQSLKNVIAASLTQVTEVRVFQTEWKKQV